LTPWRWQAAGFAEDRKITAIGSRNRSTTDISARLAPRLPSRLVTVISKFSNYLRE
jgi:hypothetical protein